jgi:hypothetical protein
VLDSFVIECPADLRDYRLVRRAGERSRRSIRTFCALMDVGQWMATEVLLLLVRTERHDLDQRHLLLVTHGTGNERLQPSPTSVVKLDPVVSTPRDARPAPVEERPQSILRGDSVGQANPLLRAVCERDFELPDHIRLD